VARWKIDRRETRPGIEPLERRKDGMKTYKIAAIGGDGIGPEVIDAGIEVLKALAKHEGTFGFQFEKLPWSSTST
jgi:hypothetical protein